MVGVGSAFAKLNYNTNALFQFQDFNLMIDFGITAPISLHEMKVPFNEINGVLITHLHADHTGGLEELAFRSLYEYGHHNGKIKLFISETLADLLWEQSLCGGLLNVEQGFTCLDDYFDVHRLQQNVSYQISDHLKIELIKTEHIPGKDSYSLIINNELFYSADMQFDRALIEHCVYERKCKIILHECSLQGSDKIHTTLEQLLSLPESIQSLIYLMHYDDNVEAFIGRTGNMQFLKQHQLYDWTDKSSL